MKKKYKLTGVGCMKCVSTSTFIFYTPLSSERFFSIFATHFIQPTPVNLYFFFIFLTSFLFLYIGYTPILIISFIYFSVKYFYFKINKNKKQKINLSFQNFIFCLFYNFLFFSKFCHKFYSFKSTFNCISFKFT